MEEIRNRIFILESIFQHSKQIKHTDLIDVSNVKFKVLIFKKVCETIDELCNLGGVAKKEFTSRIIKLVDEHEQLIYSSGIYGPVNSDLSLQCRCLGCLESLAISIKTQIENFGEIEKWLNHRIETESRKLDQIVDRLGIECPVFEEFPSLSQNLEFLVGKVGELERMEQELSEERQRLVDEIHGIEKRLGSLPSMLDSCSLRNIKERHLKVSDELNGRLEQVRASILLIERLWSLLQTETRFPLDEHCVDANYISKLEFEKKRLIDFQQERFRQLYDRQREEVERLWSCIDADSAKVKAELVGKEYTAEGLSLLSREIATLQPRYELSRTLFDLFLERKSLIEQMIEFEAKASDPNRLFGSSFRLVKEEKFRKSAYPNLLKLETRLLELLEEHKTRFNCEFKFEGAIIRPVLLAERESRIINEAIFGMKVPRYFKDESSDVKKEKISMEQQKVRLVDKQRK